MKPETEIEPEVVVDIIPAGLADLRKLMREREQITLVGLAKETFACLTFSNLKVAMERIQESEKIVGRKLPNGQFKWEYVGYDGVVRE